MILLNDGYILKIDETGRLQFIIEETGTVMDTFALRAYGTVRPGDDILLRFELVDYDVPVLDTRVGDFLAVYDKKMMWRANLYINETIGETNVQTGNLDWNNVNIWNNTENDWQGNGNGGQIAIKPWTRYDYDANTPVYNAVAYSHACYDSPQDFNDDLIDQRNAVRAWYSSDNPYWSIDEDEDGNADNVNPHPEWGFDESMEWDSTFAPGGVWGMAENNANVNYRFGIPLNDAGGHYDPLNIQVGGNTVYYPYTPNFTSKKINESPNGYRPIHTSYSSGIDCVTIIQRSAGYAGNLYYEITDLAEDRQEWNQTWAPLESVGSIESACWPLPVDGSLLIPGDILVIHGIFGDQSWGHCGIVQRIEEFGDDRSVDADRVFILDSSGAVMRIRLERNWHQMISIGGITAWSIGRPKHQ